MSSTTDAIGLDEASPSDRIKLRFLRFASFVNEAQRLRLAVGAFRLRLLKDELKKTADEDGIVGLALDWLALQGGTAVDLHLAVDYWAALEVFVEDVFTDVCASTDLAGIDRFAKVRVPLVEFEAMLPEQRFRALWERTPSPGARFAVDRWDELLGLVGVSVDMTRVEPTERRVPDNAAVRETLRELQQVRNVILHRGGLIDAKLEKVCRQGQFAAGEQLALDPELVDEYGAQVNWYAGVCTVAAVRALGGELELDIGAGPPGGAGSPGATG